MSDVVIYTAKDGYINIDVNFADETVWLSMGQMEQLFGRDKFIISGYLNNIYKLKELDRGSTVANFAIVQKDGDRKVERKPEISGYSYQTK